MYTDFQQVIQAELASIAPLASQVSAWCGDTVAADDLFHINVAIEELITNIVMHGGGAAQHITVCLQRREALLDIELRDSGPPFDPFMQPAPALALDLSSRQVGGLGIHLVRTLMHDCHYRREGDDNIVRLRKRLARGAA